MGRQRSAKADRCSKEGIGLAVIDEAWTIWCVSAADYLPVVKSLREPVSSLDEVGALQVYQIAIFVSRAVIRAYGEISS